MRFGDPVLRDWLPASALLFVSTLALAGLMLSGPVAKGKTVAAIFPPWYSKSDVLGAVSAAGGAMLRHGGIDTVALVRLDLPDAKDRLREIGAWAVVDPGGLFGCVGLTEEARRIFEMET